MVDDEVKRTKHRRDHPSDSEEDGYSTAEEEGTLEYLRPKKKRRTGDGAPPQAAAPAAAAAPAVAGPSGLQPGHVQVHERTLTDLVKTTRRVDALTSRVEAESGVKVPRTEADPMKPNIKAGDTVSLHDTFILSLHDINSR